MKIDPTFRAGTREALLAHQFLTGLPAAMQLKLLELDEMLSFSEQFLTIRNVTGNLPFLLLCTGATHWPTSLALPHCFPPFRNLMTAMKEL